MKAKLGAGYSWALLLAVAFGSSWSANCSAALATMGLGQVFGSGSIAPVSGTTPYSSIGFLDNGDGTVNLTISNPHLTGVESLSGVYLNFNDAKSVGSLTFTKVAGSGAFTDPSSINKSMNSFRPDGDGFFDILIDFDTGSTASDTFGAGDSITYRLAYTSAISIADFEFASQPGPGNAAGPYYAAAHVQNTPDSAGANSAWIGAEAYVESNLVIVPEISTVIPAGLMAILGFGTLFRRWNLGTFQLTR